MIGMLVRDENGFYFFHIKPQQFHPLLSFPAGYAHIYQYSFTAVTYIITIAVAAGI